MVMWVFQIFSFFSWKRTREAMGTKILRNPPSLQENQGAKSRQKKTN